MEPRTSEEIVQHMQPLLRKYEGDDGLIISNAEDELGSQLGDNYMSIIFRTKVEGKHKDGKPYKKIFITKCFPRNRPTAGVIKVITLFENEVHMYKKVLPAFGDFGPQCIHADSDKIVLEDMKQSGYSTCDKRLFLDLDHALYTLRTLAKYHAVSLALKLKDPSNFNKLIAPLKDIIYPEGSASSSPFGAWGNTVLPSAIRNINTTNPQTEEVKKVVQYMESFGENTFDKLMSMFKSQNDKYYVLCHGDTWTNNLLFKHDSKGNIIDLKLIDYQIARHSSSAIDFHYLVYSSVRSSVFNENYDDLILEYFNELKKQLRIRNISDADHKDLTLEWFKNELKIYKLHGLVFGIALAFPHLAEGSNVINMDELTEEEMQDADKWANLPIQANIAERMRSIALHYYRTYC